MIRLKENCCFKISLIDRVKGDLYEGEIRYLFEDENNNKFLSFILNGDNKWYIRGYKGTIHDGVFYIVNDNQKNTIARLIANHIQV